MPWQSPPFPVQDAEFEESDHPRDEQGKFTGPGAAERKLYHLAGAIYRTQSRGGHFGQIRKIGSKWHAEVRKSESGDLVRHAGIWKSRKEAHEELEDILDRVTP